MSRRRYSNDRARQITDETLDGDVKRAIIRMLATNGEVDFYGTVMMPSSRANYVRQAQERVSFLDSHRHDTTGYGHTVGGQEIDDNVFVDVAVLYDEKWNNMTYASGEDLIFALRHRHFDASIGFGNEDMNCRVCKKDMFSEECEHWLRERVTVDGKEVEVIGEIENAELLELSLVYDGATPGAGTEFDKEYRNKFIGKADRLLRAGRATPAQIKAFCERMRLPIFDNAGDGPGKGNPEPKPKKRGRQMPKTVESLQARVDELVEENEELTEEIEEIRKLHAKSKSDLKALKSENKTLSAAQTLLSEIETDVRGVCEEAFKESMKLGGTEATEEQVASYRSKLADMSYTSLRKEHQEKRDVILAIEANRDKKKGPNPDEADPVPGEGTGEKDELTLRQPVTHRASGLGL